MEQDPFGNLREWGAALQTLEDLDSSGRLAECQKGLIRILRFQENWRLREEVLKCVGKIETPSEKLIQQVIDLVCDDRAYFELRILASNVLGQLLRTQGRRSVDGIPTGLETALERMHLLLQSTQPPIFSDALHRCVRNLKETSGVALH